MLTNYLITNNEITMQTFTVIIGLLLIQLFIDITKFIDIMDREETSTHVVPK